MEETAPGLLVVTHGRLALELEKAARRIVGEVSSMASISLDWDDNVRARAGLVVSHLLTSCFEEPTRC